MSFFSDIFGDASDNGKVHQRLWPASVADMEDMSPEKLLAKGVIYSRVFRLTSKEVRKRHSDHQYCYIYAVETADNGRYELSRITYNKNDRTPTRRTTGTGTLDTVVSHFIQMENDYRASGNELVAGSTRNFDLAANMIGLHLDADNKQMAMDTAKPVTGNVQMGALSKQIFYGPAAGLPPLSTWEGFYARFVTPLLNADAAFNKATHENYVFYAGRTGLVRDYLEGLRDMVRNYDTADPRIFSCRHWRGWIMMPAQRAETRHLERLLNVSAMTALLRAGAKVVETVPDIKNGGVNLEKIDLLRRYSASLRTFLRDEFNIEGEAAQQVCDIMLKGSDPHGKDLPYDTFRKQVSAKPNDAAPKAG